MPRVWIKGEHSARHNRHLTYRSLKPAALALLISTRSPTVTLLYPDMAPFKLTEATVIQLLRDNYPEAVVTSAATVAAGRGHSHAVFVNFGLTKADMKGLVMRLVSFSFPSKCKVIIPK